MNDKLKKLERIAEILDAQTDNSEAFVLLERILALEDQIKLIEAKPLDFTTKEEVEGVFNILQDSLNEIKSNDKTQELEAKISQLLAEHRKLNKDKDYSDDYFNKELQTLKNVIADIKAIKPQEIDVNSIIQEVYQTVKDEVVKLIPEVKEVSPETIIEQIEERQLDVSSIKGLQEMVEKLTKDQKKTIIGANKPLSGLLDVNVAGILPDQSIKWNGQTWVAYTPSAGGESAFKDLTDTPNSYTSQAGKGVRVKGTEDGLEFYTTTDSDEKVKLNASDPTAGYLDDKITGYGFLDDASAFATSAQGALADTALQAEADTLQTVTDRGAVTDNDITLPSLSFDTDAEVEVTEGQLAWNDTDKTLDMGVDGVTLQLGQEMFTRVRNNTGSPLLDGRVVYANGAIGFRPTIAYAKGDTEATSRVLGVLTEDIANNTDGFVTTVGYVRQIKTNYTGTGIWGTTWVTGDKLWVSKTDAGVLTNVEPEAPHSSDLVATVGVVGAEGLGSILVNIQRHICLKELCDIDGTPLTTDGQILTYHATEGYFDFDKNINDYLPTATASSTYVPYTGNLNVYSPNINKLQYIKSIDKLLITAGTPIIQDNAIYVNGTTDYLISDSANNDFDVGTNDFSMGIWFNTTAVTNGYLAGQGNPSSTNGRGYAIRKIGATAIGLVYNNGSGAAEIIQYNGPAGAMTNGWKHILFTVDRTNSVVKLYFNGEMILEQAIVKTDSFSHAVKNMAIGRGSSITGVYYEGLLDDFVFYNNKLLTGSQVSDIYNSGRGYTPISEGLTAQYTSRDYSGTTSTPVSFYNVREEYKNDYLDYWKSGNVIYVPVGADIQSYVTSSKNGDTLVLGSGTYTVTSSITTTGKEINIVGQGRDKTIINANVTTLFVVTSGNIRFASFSINHTIPTTGFAFNVGVIANDFINNVIIEDISIVQSGGSTSYGIRYANVNNGLIRNVKLYSRSASSVQYGIIVATYSGAVTGDGKTVIENVDVDVDAPTAYGIYTLDSSATQDAISYIYNSRVKATGAASNGIRSTNGDALSYVYNTIIEGQQWDAIQSASAVLQLSNCLLVNNKAFGAITYAGTLYNGASQFNGLVNIGSGFTSPPSTLSSMTPSAYITANTDTINGIMMGNANTGTTADYRFIIRDSLNSYMAFQYAGSGRTSTSIFGLANNTWGGIFTQGDTTAGRHLLLGTLQEKDLILGTKNLERARFLGSNGDFVLKNDNQKIYLGADKDASFYYDNTNFVINPKEVGSGILNVLGEVKATGYQSSDGTAGLTATKVFNDGAVVNTVTIKNGLITSWTQI